jgi:uncharacterized protein HemY
MICHHRLWFLIFVLTVAIVSGQVMSGNHPGSDTTTHPTWTGNTGDWQWQPD